MDPDAVARSVQENLVGFFRDVGTLSTGEFHEEPGLQWHWSGLPSPMFSGVGASGLEGEDLNGAIDRLKDRSDQTGVPMFWWVGPLNPASTSAALSEAGFIPFEVDAPGMAMAIDDLEDRSMPEGIEVRRVRDRSELETWSSTFVEAYEVPEMAGRSWVDATLDVGIEHAAWRMYTGFDGDRPVGTTMLWPYAGVAGLTGIATLHSDRGRGVGRALTLAPMIDAETMGLDVAVLFASDLGYSVYKKLGFKDVCTISRYLYGLS